MRALATTPRRPPMLIARRNPNNIAKIQTLHAKNRPNFRQNCACRALAQQIYYLLRPICHTKLPTLLLLSSSLARARAQLNKLARTKLIRTFAPVHYLCVCARCVTITTGARACAFAGDVATMMTPADLVANQTNARAAPMARRRLLDRWRRSHSRRRRRSRTRRSTPYTIRAALQRASTLRPRLT